MPKTVPAAVRREFARMESEYPKLWLLRVELSPTETVYLCSGNENIAFDPGDGEGPVTWITFPFVVNKIAEDGRGNLGSLELSISNATLEVGRAMWENRSFTGQAVTLILVLRDTDAGTTTEAFRYDAEIQDSAVPIQGAAFKIGRQSLLHIQVPRQRAFRDRCRFRYKGLTYCTYSGVEPTCDLSLRGPNGCEFHVNEDRHGGFPGIPRRT